MSDFFEKLMSNPLFELSLPVMFVGLIAWYFWRFDHKAKVTRRENIRKRNEWLLAHFPVEQYSIEIVGPLEFIKALFNDSEAVLWEYLNEWKEAREVIGGIKGLVSPECTADAKEYGSLICVSSQYDADHKKKVYAATMLDGVKIQLLLQRLTNQNHMKDTILSQTQYEGYAVIYKTLDEINEILKNESISLWEYVPTWRQAMRIAPADYGNRDLDKCIYTNYWTFDYLFAVCDNDKTIILPYLEFTAEGVKTVPFVFDHSLMPSTERC